MIESQLDTNIKSIPTVSNSPASSKKAPLKSMQVWNRVFEGQGKGVKFTVRIQRKLDGSLHARYRVHPGTGRDWPMEGIIRTDNSFVLIGKNQSRLEGAFNGGGTIITAQFQHRQFEISSLTLKRSAQPTIPARSPAATKDSNTGSTLITGQVDIEKVDPALRSRIESTKWKPATTSKKDRHAVFHNIVSIARALGSPFPELIAAQWALESGWGKAPSGKNNLFGIKEFDPKKPRTMVTTHEYNSSTGQNEVRIEPFRDYSSYTAGFVDRINLMFRNPAYRKAGFFSATTLREAAQALKKAGYATDSAYVTLLVNTMKGCGIDVDAEITASKMQAEAPAASTTPPAKVPLNSRNSSVSGAVSEKQPDALDRMMTFTTHREIYSADEIAKARQLIKGKTEGQRAALYSLLQSKVAYQSQRDNVSIGRREDEQYTPFGSKLERVGQPLADIMCNLTAVAMTLESLGIENPDPIKFPQFEDYLEDLRRKLADAAVAKQKTVQDKINMRKYMHRESQGGWGAVLNAMGTTHHEIQNVGARTREWWENNALREIHSGNSVLFSINGHIVRLQNMDDRGLIVDDPYGQLQRLRNSVKGVSAKYVDAKGVKHLNTKTRSSDLGEDNVWKWEDVTRYDFLWISIVKAK